MVEATIHRQSQPLTKQELVELSKIKQWIVARDITVTWAIIWGTVLLTLWQPYIPIIIMAWIVIGAMQNTLILWTHEASHYHITRNRNWNDFIGDFFAAGPVGITVAQYRWEHIPHHLHLGNPEHDANPLLWMCIRGGHLFSQFFLHITGIRFIQLFIRRFLGTGYPNDIIQKGTHAPYPTRSKASLAGFFLINLVILMLCVATGKWYLFPFLWLAPFFTVALLLNSFRTIVEHQPSTDVCDTGKIAIPPSTRMVESNWLERNLIAGVGFYYHYEHHAFPGLPYHRLPEVRRLLEQRGHFADESQPFMKSDVGYIRTIWRLAMTPGYGIRLLNPFFEPDATHHTHPESITPESTV